MALDSFEPEAPRRNALRALFASGLAVVGLSRVIESAPPSNTIPISVLAQINNSLCWISNSTTDASGTGWDLRVTCQTLQTTTGTAQAICLK